jgi:hypothetical protein
VIQIARDPASPAGRRITEILAVKSMT